MTSATIKLFLPRGDAKSLRTAEISNWTGKAVAAPRTELDELLVREELDKSGVYILIGSDPLTNAPRAYIGEAEVIRASWGTSIDNSFDRGYNSRRMVGGDDASKTGDANESRCTDTGGMGALLSRC